MKQFLNLMIMALILSVCLFTTGCNSDTDRRKDETINRTQKGKDAMNNEDRLLLMDQIDRKKLQEIQYWFMKKGVAEFYKTRDTSPIAEYVKSRGYGLILPPQIDRYHMHEGRKIHAL